MSKDELLSALTSSKPIRKDETNSKETKSNMNFSKSRIEKIRKEFNEKNLFASKLKEIERNLTELEENLFKTKKHYDYDDIKYKGIRNVKDLFDLLIDGDYYKPIITKDTFNNNYIQYESKGDKGKNLSIKNILI